MLVMESGLEKEWKEAIMVMAGDEKASVRKLKLCSSDGVQKDLERLEVKNQMASQKVAWRSRYKCLSRHGLFNLVERL